MSKKKSVLNAKHDAFSNYAKEIEAKRKPPHVKESRTAMRRRREAANSLAARISMWKEKHASEASAAESHANWLHAAHALSGTFLIGRAHFGGVMYEVIARGQILVAIAERHSLIDLANALSWIDIRYTLLSKTDPVNAFLRAWHDPATEWKVPKPQAREAIMLAMLAARFVTAGQKEAAKANIEQAAYMAVRGVEAISKAETSHDLVAANVAFYLLAERAMEAGKTEGVASEKSERGRIGGLATAQRRLPVKAEAYRLAREYVQSRSASPTRRSVAIAIRQKVKDFAASIGVRFPGSDESILTTIYLEWLPEMEDADALFAAPRSKSTG